MSLPLPPAPNGFWWDSAALEALKSYGQACREAALEEAALAAFEAPVKTYKQDTRDACANAIRRLKS